MMGRFFVQSRGGELVELVDSGCTDFLKKTKIRREASKIVCFLGKIYVSFWGGCLVVPTWMEAQKNLQSL